MARDDLRGALGVYGGTFNPIHLGHLRAAEEVAEALGLERVLFVPNARPPHKRADPDADPIAEPKERLEWVRLAVEDNARFEVDAIEIEREGKSYLVDTLSALRERNAGRPPVFIVGRDAFCDTGAWREPRRLFELAHFAVTTRPPEADGALAQWMPDVLRGDFEIAADGRSAHHRSAETSIRFVPITALDISASAIRERLRSGLSIRYLVPRAVEEAILASGCYSTSGGEAQARARRGTGGRKDPA